MAERYVETPPAGLEGWREVWREDLRFRVPPQKNSFLRALAIRILTPLVRQIFQPDEARQRDSNIATLELISDLRRDIADLQREAARLRDLLPVSVRRNDALVTALDQKIEAVASRVRDLAQPALESLPPSFREDFLYRRLEDAFRGDVSETMRGYAALARGHAPALDVGCGRGEFLAACRDAGIEATGIDTNERSIADLRAQGFRVLHGAIPQALVSMEAGSLGAILASHVVEHLPPEPLLALFAEAARLLRRGGLLMIETPNAERFTAAEFWRDPTHIAPRPASALTVLGREFGFEIAESGGEENLRLVLRKA